MLRLTRAAFPWSAMSDVDRGLFPGFAMSQDLIFGSRRNHLHDGRRVKASAPAAPARRAARTVPKTHASRVRPAINTKGK